MDKETRLYTAGFISTMLFAAGSIFVSVGLSFGLGVLPTLQALAEQGELSDNLAKTYKALTEYAGWLSYAGTALFMLGVGIGVIPTFKKSSKPKPEPSAGLSAAGESQEQPPKSSG